MTEPLRKEAPPAQLLAGFEVMIQLVDTWRGVALVHKQEAAAANFESLLRAMRMMLSDARAAAAAEVTSERATPLTCEACGHVVRP